MRDWTHQQRKDKPVTYSHSYKALWRNALLAGITLASALHFGGCVPVSEPVAVTTLLSGADVVPATDSSATGSASFTVDRGLKTITGTVTIEGFNPISVTLNSAAAGSNGAIAVTLTQTGASEWRVPANETLSSAEFSAVDSGRLYVIATSAAWPDGEIRGQLPAAGLTPTLASIQKYVFKPNCAVAGCHGGSNPIHGWDLRTEAASYNTLVYRKSHIEPDSGLNLVEPGDPDNSFLIRKLEGTANTPGMPMALPKLPQSQIDVIRQWISDLPVTPQPSLVYLQKHVFDVSCATSGCHSGPDAQANLDLSAGNTLANVLNVDSTVIAGMKVIDPGHPDTSSLYQRVANEDFAPRMPPVGHTPLTPEQIEAVRGWIESLLPPQPTLAWIQTNIFDTTCAFAGCHDAVTHSFNLDLSPGASEAELINVASSIEFGETLVIPGDPDNSYLVKKLENRAANGVSMPWLLPLIPPQKIQAVRSWIAALDGVPDPDPDPDPTPTPEPTQAWLQTNVFNTRCIGCHGNGLAQQGLNLTDIALQVGRNSAQQPAVKVIAAGDADASYLVRKVEGSAGITGQRMPPGPALTATEIDMLRQWINGL